MPITSNQLKTLCSKILNDLKKPAPPPSRVDSAYTGATRKYSRNQVGRTGDKHNPYDEEATVYVWHEKNFANLPGWLDPNTFNVGHASMKLCRYDSLRERNLRVDYLSWGAGNISSRAQISRSLASPAGVNSENTERAIISSRVSSIESEAVRQILTMIALWEANKHTSKSRADFRGLAQELWESLSNQERKALKDKGVEPNYANIKSLKYRLQQNQKVLSLMRAKQYREYEEDYYINPRLKALAAEPYLLDQQDLGSCPIATSVMALCRVQNPGDFLAELLDAIWNGNQFRQMVIWKGGTGKRAKPGIVRERLLRRLRVIPPSVLQLKRGKLLDYFLIVGLSIFFKTHLKYAAPDKYKRLIVSQWTDTVFDTDQLFDWKNKKKIKEIEREIKQGNRSLHHWHSRSPERGDFPLNPSGVEELLTLLMPPGQYDVHKVVRPLLWDEQTDKPLIPKEQQEFFLRKVVPEAEELEARAVTVLCNVGDPMGYLMGHDLDTPIAENDINEIRQHKNTLQERKGRHWVVKKPCKSKISKCYWTWGEETNWLKMTRFKWVELTNVYVVKKIVT